MSNLGHLLKEYPVHITSLVRKKNRSRNWYKPELQSDRKLDSIDHAVLSMARSIRWMNERAVPFAPESYKKLISDYSRCARLNWSLNPTQRLYALNALNDKTIKATLENVLTDASKQ
jgi:hypothetical protein